MHTKRLLLIVLSFVMICGVFGCKDKNADSGDGYVLPETEILINRSSGGLQDEYKFTYEYDSYGNIVKEEQYSKGTFYIREYCIDRTYTYDENGKITKEIIREEYFRTSITSSHQISEKGYNYYYNESGRLVKKETTHHRQDGSIVAGFISEYKDFVKP